MCSAPLAMADNWKDTNTASLRGEHSSKVHTGCEGSLNSNGTRNKKLKVEAAEVSEMKGGLVA